MSTRPPYLKIEALSKHYGSMAAVDEVSLEVAAGEMVVLLGPSGCGKTTTLRLIAGFVEASAGRILLEGRDYAGLPPYQREMGMVFQSYALFPHMTVAQNISFGLRMRKMPAAQISSRLEEVLALVKLEKMADRYPKQLSGGQQQRVALARALAIRPKLLLLDEPLSNLDANLRQEVAREIRRLQRGAGLTALMVTHDQDEAMAMADRLVVMDRGRVQQVGPQEALYEAPENPFVARFIGHSNLLRGTLRDGCRLQLGEGVEAQLAQRYNLAGDATLALRPERIRLLPPGDPTPARMTLAVEDATYVGAHVEYLLALPGGGSLILHQPTTGLAGAARLSPGSRAALTWDAGSERIFDAADRALAAAGPAPALASV